VRQTKLNFPPGWGGKRRGAGRKPKGKRAGVSHLRRPPITGRAPLLVTVPLVPAVGRLRTKTKLRALREAFRAGRERFGFRLVHYSVQSRHLHLMVEATDQRALSRGMQGLSIRIARRLNRLLGRKGKVFADRYHARELKTPLEVKRGLQYLLNNGRRHAAQSGARWSRNLVDTYSSGTHFTGWCRPVRTFERWNLGDPVTADPKSWLLRVGWKRHGLLDPAYVPGGGERILAAWNRG
jgi:REP element-mobilizing transposase RayT